MTEELNPESVRRAHAVNAKQAWALPGTVLCLSSNVSVTPARRWPFFWRNEKPVYMITTRFLYKPVGWDSDLIAAALQADIVRQAQQPPPQASPARES